MRKVIYSHAYPAILWGNSIYLALAFIYLVYTGKEVPGTCADPECGVQGSAHTPAKSQKYRVSSNTGPDPLKNHKATKPAFNIGPSSARQYNAFRWRAYDGPQ